jgi:hypothetical protein
LYASSLCVRKTPYCIFVPVPRKIYINQLVTIFKCSSANAFQALGKLYFDQGVTVYKCFIVTLLNGRIHFHMSDIARNITLGGSGMLIASLIVVMAEVSFVTIRKAFYYFATPPSCKNNKEGGGYLFVSVTGLTQFFQLVDLPQSSTNIYAFSG